MQLGGLPVATDVSAGRWIPDAVRGRTGVAAVVPAVFDAYARVFHPATRYAGEDDEDVSWAEVAEVNGTVTHSRMQWPAITGGWEYLHEDSQPPTWDAAPAEGHLPVVVAVHLVAVLARHTRSPGDCWFGRWDGFGFDAAALDGVPRLALPGAHDVVLVRGTVADAVRNLAPEPHEQSANVWWPADRAWCVVTDIDLMETYVGGSEAAIEDLLATEGLEVSRTDPEDPVGWREDPVNPIPDRE